jgi:hypothetical protein
LRAAWFGLLCAWVACGGEPVSVPTPTPMPAVGDLGAEVATVRPVWAGCNELLDGVCLIWRSRGADTAKERELRAWLDVAPSTGVAVEIDGVAVEAEAVAADAGVRLHIPIPSRAASIVLRGSGVEGSLRLEYLEFGEAFDGAVEAINRGEVKAGCGALAEIGESSPWVDRVQAAARIADHCNDRSAGDRLSKLQAAAALARQAGYVRTFGRITSAIAYVQLIELGDGQAARGSAGKLESVGTGSGELEAWAGYIADRAGDSNAALESATRVHRWASRLKMPLESRGALEMQGTILARSGRATEAIALARAVAAEGLRETQPCDRARTLINATWIHQLLAESELPNDPPYDGMLAVMAIYESGECVNPREALHARVNIARAAVAEAEFEVAERWIAGVDAEDPLLALQDLRMEVEDVRAAIALGTGRWELAPIPLLLRRPQDGSPRIRWQSATRDAQLLERFGLADAAIEAWSRAEAVVETTVVPGPNGAEYISGRARSIHGLVGAHRRRPADDRAGGDGRAHALAGAAHRDLRVRLGGRRRLRVEIGAARRRRRARPSAPARGLLLAVVRGDPLARRLHRPDVRRRGRLDDPRLGVGHRDAGRHLHGGVQRRPGEPARRGEQRVSPIHCGG